ncbi:MAG: sensor histidine kinase, partial [Actinobacteria bacterium]
MNTSSIRFRITAIATLAVSVVLLIAAVGLVVVQSRQLTATNDAALGQRADDLTSLLETADAVPAVFAETTEEGFVQLLDSTGRVLASTPNLQGQPPLPVPHEPSSTQTVRTVDGLVVDDDVFRVLSRTVQLANGDAVLHVGSTYDVVAESTSILRNTLAVAIPLVVLLLAGLVWWLVGRTLQPVEDIRAEVAAIGATDLDRRVPQPGSGDEIDRLAETMNRMLARLESSVDRQQRFVADASHELRSPLTRMRTEIEVDLAAEPEGASRERMESLREEVIALQQLVEDLLDLARADAAETPLRAEPVDLDDVVLREGRRLHADGRVAVDLSAVSAAHVRGDAAQLARAIRNLADNAERHAAGLVSFALGEGDGNA